MAFQDKTQDEKTIQSKTILRKSMCNIPLSYQTVPQTGEKYFWHLNFYLIHKFC